MEKPLRVVLVGAGSPLGAAVAQGLHEKGSDMFMISTAACSIPESFPDALQKTGSVTIDPLRCSEWRCALQEANNKLGGIDFLIYLDTAYHHEPFSPAADISAVRSLMNTNCIAPIYAIQASLPLLRASSGHIALLMSPAQGPGPIGTTMYMASKRGLAAFVTALRKREPLVAVTSIFPGKIIERSLILQESAPAASKAKAVQVPPQLLKNVMDSIIIREESCSLASRPRSVTVKEIPAAVGQFFANGVPEIEPAPISKQAVESSSELTVAVLENNRLRVKEILKVNKADLTKVIQASDAEGRCALHYASYLGHLEFVSAMLRTNWRELVETSDSYGWTPLHFAAAGGHLRLTKRLLQDHADPNALTHSGLSCLHFLARLSPGDDPKIVARYLLTLKKLLDRGADVNQRNVNWVTPLHEAAASRSLIALQFFLENEGDPHRKTRVSKETPLQYAMKANNTAVIRMLLEAGADPVGCFDIAPPKIFAKLEEYREVNRRPDPDFNIEEKPVIYVSAIEDLPDDAKQLLEFSGMAEAEMDNILAHWDEFLIALRFLTRKRLKNGRGRAADQPDEPEEEEEDSQAEEDDDEETRRERAKEKRKARSRLSHGMNLEECYNCLVANGNPAKLFALERHQIGRGGFGTVFKGRRIGERGEVAVKKLAHLTEKEQWSNLDEIYFLQNLDHKCIVPYDSSYRYRDELWIAMDYLAGGTLQEVCKTGRLEEGHIAYVVKRMLEGLVYLHKKNYVHRDLKSANIMLDLSGNVFIIDFGLCMEMPYKKKGMVGSPFWMPPEMMKGVEHTAAGDIWSLGVICLEMAETLPPHHSSALRSMFMTATGAVPTLSDETKWSPEFSEFLKRALEVDPAQRATAKELLKDPWIEMAETQRVMQTLLQHVFVEKSLETLLV